MRDEEIESQLYRVKQSHIEAADEVMKLIHELAETPADGCLILLLAHAKLWAGFGASPAPVMLTSYVRDFITVAKMFDEYSAPPGEPLQ